MYTLELNVVVCQEHKNNVKLRCTNRLGVEVFPNTLKQRFKYRTIFINLLCRIENVLMMKVAYNSDVNNILYTYR